MDEELDNPEVTAIGRALPVIGILAAAAIFAGGGLAILGGAVAIACFAGSVMLDARSPESPCERFCRECDQAVSIPSDDLGEPVINQPVHEQGKHWAASVDAGKRIGRSR